jgi:hypothetical protein
MIFSPLSLGIFSSFFTMQTKWDSDFSEIQVSSPFKISSPFCRSFFFVVILEPEKRDDEGEPRATTANKNAFSHQ